MTKKQVGTVFFYILIGFPILVFILMPTHAIDPWAVSFEHFLDKYLFGNGYFKPDRYPFAAKVTNSLTVLLAVVLGILYATVFRNEPYHIPKKDRKKVLMGLFVLFLFCLWLSIFPQEFSTTTGRGFGIKRSFHNDTVFFLFMIICIKFAIYTGVVFLGQFFFQGIRWLKLKKFK
ncbi:hypothetical protein ACFPVS_03240 [Neisseria weixii]|uniref:hypothetical protein n=1 Tax=Neisseria weixii TaxID=1853276 RepID=UPI000BB70811|nr:hypothetical protein [Neisseria weixii]ATD65248.1 hypothetical protein CGZ65_07965 [Neisseria weixii]